VNRELSLGKYIRELREQKRLSLLELSNRTGLAYSHLSRIENESTVPSPDTIVKIAEEIGGDITLMLNKANNLPRVILDRLIERDRAVGLQTLHRAIPGRDAQSPSDDVLEGTDLTQAEIEELQAALEGLLRLHPHARRAVINLISVIHDDEETSGAQN